MYRYYQIGEKTKWEAIQDGPDVEQRAIDKGARKVTILAVSEIITDETSRQTLAYKGGWYADIDSKDIVISIASARELVNKLTAMQVPDWAIQLYASGSKGFHVHVPPSVFSSGRPMKDLPAIYKEMALELYVLGMDFQVYSGGRGVSWRLPNIQRDDGRYRVPITIDELFSMTPEDYARLTSNPRILPTPAIDHDYKSVAFEALMDRAKRRARSRPKVPEPVLDDDLRQFQDEPPPCMTELMEYKTRPSKNFNEVAYQLAIYIARSGTPDVLASSMMARMAARGESNSYNTPRARQDHIMGLVQYMQSTPSTKFSCNAVRSVMINRPCQDCALCQTGDEEAEPGEEVGLVSRSDGYYILAPNGDRRISTFTLEAVDAYYDQAQAGRELRRVGTTLEVCRDGQVLGSVRFKESGWGAKSQFKHELSGIANVAFYGTEDDIQRIKHIVFDEGKDMGEIIQVYSAGIHRYKVGAKPIMVYVEPSLSINQYKIRGTHQLEGTISSPPCIKDVELPAVGDKGVSETLRNLLKVNRPEVVAQLIGWYCACHLKTHLMRLYNQFPLLSLWGQAGAGKTMTAVLFSGLNGCNPVSEDGSLSLAGITNFAIVNFCSTTTTVPRILEEYNKSKLPRRLYDYCGEVMKMGWNQQVIAKGTIRRSNVNGSGRSGADVIEYPISSPMVITSEQAPQMPALKQRMIQVQMTKNEIKDEDRQDAFFAAQAEPDQLRRMAKAMVIQALNVDTNWIKERMLEHHKKLPKKLIARPRYAYQVLLLGLDFFKNVVDDLQLVGIEVDPLIDALYADVSDRAAMLYQDKMRTEIDIMMDEIGIMIQQTLNDSARWLVSGSHYVVSEGRVVFDVPVMFAAYKLYKNNLREPLIIENTSQFQQLIEHEPYCVTTNSTAGAVLLRINRPTLELDMSKMQNKGIDVSMYG